MYITLSIYINNKKHNKFCFFSYNIFSQKKKKSFMGKCHRISRSRHELFRKCPHGTATDTNRHGFDGRPTRRSSRYLLLAHEMPKVPFREMPKWQVFWTNPSNSCELWKQSVRYWRIACYRWKHRALRRVPHVTCIVWFGTLSQLVLTKKDGHLFGV